MLLENLTWPEFQEKAQTVKRAIIPVGPIEEHGPHLPLGTDFIQPYEFAKKVAEKIDVFVLPPIPLGVCWSANNFPGTIAITEKTMTAVIEDLLEGLIKNKLEKILVFNGHSGSRHLPAIALAFKKMKKKYPKVKMWSLNFHDTYEEVIPEIIETKGDSHSGEIETSRFLALKPELVHKDKLVGEKAPEFKTEEQLKDPQKYWETGVNGDATKASLAKGEKLIERGVEMVCELLG